MFSKIKIASTNLVNKIKSYFDETDIQTLVYIPPLLGFGGYISLFLILESFIKKPLPESYGYIGLGIASLITSIAGIAEIYKKEMPISFERSIKGKIAIFSGMIIIIIFGIGGLYLFWNGIILLINK